MVAETVKITAETVDRAIDIYLGADVAQAMRAGGIGRPTMIRNAIVAAFVSEQRLIPWAYVLREAQMRLDESGVLRFDR